MGGGEPERADTAGVYRGSRSKITILYYSSQYRERESNVTEIDIQTVCDRVLTEETKARCGDFSLMFTHYLTTRLIFLIIIFSFNL